MYIIHRYKENAFACPIDLYEYLECIKGISFPIARPVHPVRTCTRFKVVALRKLDQYSSVFFVGASIKRLVGRLVPSLPIYAPTRSLFPCGFGV